MRIQEAKLVPLEKILNRRGYHVVKTRNDPKHGLQLLFRSPFRDDKEPSFVVTVSLNLYFDNGLGHMEVNKSDPCVCGNALDLETAFLGARVKGQYIREALKSLDAFGSSPAVCSNLAMKKIATGKEKEKSRGASLELVEKKPLFSYVLKNYLRDMRKLNLALVQPYVYEVKYKKTNTEHVYFGIGFPAGDGFEVISGGTKGQKRFKGFVGTTKGISTIECQTDTCLVFSGFIDFLSYLTYKNLAEPKHSVIILHSDHLTQKGIDWLKPRDWIKSVYYFRDRDEIKPITEGKKVNQSGLLSFQAFVTQLNDRNITDVSEQRYPDYVDLNDLLTNTKPN